MVTQRPKRVKGAAGPVKVICASCGQGFTVGAPDYRPYDAVCPWCLTANRVDR